MRATVVLLFCLLPTSLAAAAGGVGDGFGADDWLRKWPVLVIVLGAVVGMTGFLSIKVFRRARMQKGSKQ